MPKAQSFQIGGVKELQKAFQVFGPKIGRKLGRDAVKKGLKPILEESKKRAAEGPYATGAAAEHIKIRATLKRKNGLISFEVRVGAGDFVGKSFYLAMKEYGTKKQPARPMLRPAFETQKDAAAKIVIRELRDGIEKLSSK